jgi:O-antigen ligase
MNRFARSAPDRSAASWNVALAVLLGAIYLVPLLAFPSNALTQNLAGRLLLGLTGLLAGLLIWNMPAGAGLRPNRVLAFLGEGANLAAQLFVFSALLSLWLGPAEPAIRRVEWARLLQIVAGVLLYFTVAYLPQRSAHLQQITNALMYVGLGMAAIGLAQFAAQPVYNRVDLFGNAQLFGGFLMILLPLPLMLALTERDTKRNIFAQVSTALMLLGLVASGLRSAWIATGAMLLFLLAASRIGAVRQRPGEGVRLSALIPLLTILAGCLFAALQGDVYKIVATRLQAGGTSFQDRQTQNWHAAIQLFLLRPAFGTGPGTYALYQFPYSRQGRPGEQVLRDRPSLSENAHNFWLQTAAEQGAVGAALFAGIVLSALIAGLDRLRTLRDGPRRTLLLASLAAIVGFAVDAISNPAWFFGQIAMFFWIQLGLSVACGRLRERDEEA